MRESLWRKGEHWQVLLLLLLLLLLALESAARAGWAEAERRRWGPERQSAPAWGWYLTLCPHALDEPAQGARLAGGLS